MNLDIWSILDVLDTQADATLPPTARTAERAACRFTHAMAHLPIGVNEDEQIAGSFGWEFVDDERQAAYFAEHQRLANCTPPPKSAAQTAQELLWNGFHCGGGYTTAHTCADYQRIVEHGLLDVVTQIDNRLLSANPSERNTLAAMRRAVEAIGVLASRYAEAAAKQAAATIQPTMRADLERIAANCARVPMNQAESFHEALQSIWLIHLCIGFSERSTASLSLGRIDQFLLPFYRRDLARGVTREELKASLRTLFLHLNGFGDAACAVNLGGLDAEGHDLFNELSALIVETATELALPSPILAVRLHQGFPDSAFQALLDPRLLSIGQPTFYGELPCREAMVRRGVAPMQAHSFAVNSCMGLVMPGAEISDMWGGVVNLTLPLELAMNDGRPLTKALPYESSVRSAAAYASCDALFDKYTQYLEEIITRCLELNRMASERAAAEAPNPFLSSITRGCVERARDRAWRGADWHCVIAEGFGWASVADAFVAIARLVFDKQTYSLAEMAAACAYDFDGPAGQAILQAIRACPKYGSGDREADAMAARVSSHFAAAVSRHSDANLRYLPSYHTLHTHIDAGAKTGATPDGRRQGEPLGKQLAPLPGRNTRGFTGMLLSASAVDQRAMSGGQALDISLNLAETASKKWRAAFKAALLAYFDRGGMQVQVNALSAQQMREAMADANAHPNLAVRIGGFSMHFRHLSPQAQEDMAVRVEQGI